MQPVEGEDPPRHDRKYRQPGVPGIEDLDDQWQDRDQARGSQWDDGAPQQVRHERDEDRAGDRPVLDDPPRLKPEDIGHATQDPEVGWWIERWEPAIGVVSGGPRVREPRHELRTKASIAVKSARSPRRATKDREERK